jgi:hypothetical protein
VLTGDKAKMKIEPMKVGDLVWYSPGRYCHPHNTLTAAKYFERVKKRCGKKPGVILSLHGDNCKVMFGSDVMMLHKEFLEAIDEDR